MKSLVERRRELYNLINTEKANRRELAIELSYLKEVFKEIENRPNVQLAQLREWSGKPIDTDQLIKGKVRAFKDMMMAVREKKRAVCEIINDLYAELNSLNALQGVKKT